MSASRRSAPRRALLFAALDQGSMSVFNFGQVILFGRALPVDEFGRFVLVYAAVSLCFSIASSMWAAPALTFLAGKYAGAGRRYAYRVSALGVGTALALAGPVLLLSAATGGRLSAAEALAAAALAATSTLHDALRRAGYAYGRERRLAAAGVVLLAAFLGGYWGMLAGPGARLSWALALLAASYAAACLVGWPVLRTRPAGTGEDPGFAETARSHWSFFRWTSVGILGYWVSTQGYFLLAAPFLSAGELAGLRSTQNLLSAVTVVLQLGDNVLGVRAASILTAQGAEALREYVGALYRRLSAPFVVSVAAAGAAAYALLPVLYGSGYARFQPLVPVFALAQLLAGAWRPAAAELKAREHTHPFFVGHLSSAVVTCTLGVALAARYAAPGAAWSFVMSGALLCSAILWSSQRRPALNSGTLWRDVRNA